MNAYLLGGWVDHVTFSPTPSPIVGYARPELFLSISGRGLLGCTPAGAGAGTKQGYHWCRPVDRYGTGAVSAQLVIDRRSGLPLRFTANASAESPAWRSSQREDVTFSYTDPVAIRLPRARRVPCLSWIPAIHCIELGYHRSKDNNRQAAHPGQASAHETFAETQSSAYGMTGGSTAMRVWD